jgi:hypothetical protein
MRKKKKFSEGIDKEKSGGYNLRHHKRVARLLHVIHSTLLLDMPGRGGNSSQTFSGIMRKM